MIAGARVTDEVAFYWRRGEMRNAVRVVRKREPERLRWRTAVSNVTGVAGKLRGRDRMIVEEPVREMIVDLDDRILRREVVLDARRNAVDLDRGEVLPVHDMWSLCRTAYLTGVDLEKMRRYLTLPHDPGEPVDTAGVVLVGRAFANMHQRRAQTLMGQLPENAERLPLHRQQRYVLQRAKHDVDMARRWTALAKTMAG